MTSIFAVAMVTTFIVMTSMASATAMSSTTLFDFVFTGPPASADLASLASLQRFTKLLGAPWEYQCEVQLFADQINFRMKSLTMLSTEMLSSISYFVAEAVDLR